MLCNVQETSWSWLGAANLSPTSTFSVSIGLEDFPHSKGKKKKKESKKYKKCRDSLINVKHFDQYNDYKFSFIVSLG